MRPSDHPGRECRQRKVPRTEPSVYVGSKGKEAARES